MGHAQHQHPSTAHKAMGLSEQIRIRAVMQIHHHRIGALPQLTADLGWTQVSRLGAAEPEHLGKTGHTGRCSRPCLASFTAKNPTMSMANAGVCVRHAGKRLTQTADTERPSQAIHPRPR
jgi:hypothetical protein